MDVLTTFERRPCASTVITGMAVEPPYVAAVTEVFASNPASTFVNINSFVGTAYIHTEITAPESRIIVLQIN